MSDDTHPARDRDDAEAQAERLLAMHRVREQVEDRLGEQQRVVSRWIMLVAAAAFGALGGAMLGTLRGQPGLGAVLIALLAVMLTLALLRPR